MIEPPELEALAFEQAELDFAAEDHSHPCHPYHPGNEREPVSVTRNGEEQWVVKVTRPTGEVVFWDSAKKMPVPSGEIEGDVLDVMQALQISNFSRELDEMPSAPSRDFND